LGWRAGSWISFRKPDPFAPMFRQILLHPLNRVRLRDEPRPAETFQKIFAPADLRGPFQPHCFVPGDSAPIDAARRVAMRLSRPIALPNTICAVGMACSTTQHTR